jgi:hypothetical protein
MMHNKIVLLGLCLSLMLSSQTWAVPIVVPGQDITVDGSATFNGAVWEYRYTIKDTLGLAVTPVRFIISEHDSHVGLHHEFDFLNDGGTFQYDFPVPLPFKGVSAHNYFWNALDIPANGSVVVGFNDAHGPALATWGIQARGQCRKPDPKLPVPAPEPGSLALFFSGLLGFLSFRKLKNRPANINRNITR